MLGRKEKHQAFDLGGKRSHKKSINNRRASELSSRFRTFVVLQEPKEQLLKQAVGGEGGCHPVSLRDEEICHN